MNTIDFKHVNIHELLQDFYIVPDYQREYVWEEENIIDLLEDIFTEFSSDKAEYFLGSIIVCKNLDTNKLEVIDGQQRLITLSLILAVIKEIYKSNYEDDKVIDKYLYSSKINEIGNIVYSHIIQVEYDEKGILYKILRQEEIITNEVVGVPCITIYHAYEVIKKYIEDNFEIKNDITRLKLFVGYFLNSVRIIRIETKDLNSALKIFETINERGVGLDQVDLLKNLIFRQIKREDFNRLKLEWNKFKREIQGNEVNEKPLRFIRYFTIANYDVSINDDQSDNDTILRKEQIYEWYINNESKCNIKKDPFKFVQTLYEFARYYIGFLKQEYYGKSNLYLKNIKSLVGNSMRLHYILLLATKKMDPKLFNHFVAQLEVLLFYYQITNVLPRDIERKFFKWAIQVQQICTIKQLNEFLNNTFKKEIDTLETKYKNQFKDPKFYDVQKYKLKYILAKLTEYVDRKHLGNESPLDLDIYLNKNVNIEHILPETPTKEVVDLFCKGDIKIYNSYKTKIGNLTLLEQTINKSIQNNNYEKKKYCYLNSRFYLTKSISKIDNTGKSTSISRINRELSEYIKWDKESIDHRTDLLFNLSRKVWCITELKD